ncbi:LPS translocon maturation chaperone LptM [Kerstersia similis]|uniref:LPS translocon maturation chaperone LptM n=1 Tax=Kerstersia similis TaxID=206505 RepID=UPI0039F05E32
MGSRQEFSFSHNRTLHALTEFPVFTLARLRSACRILASIALIGQLLACGYKGPLYLPSPQSQTATTTSSAT